MYSIIGWTTAILVTLGVLYAMAPAINGNVPNDYIAALYSATSRIVWSLSLAWITFASITGYGWVFNSFLSCKIWIPLSRLSYCAYLIHPIVIALFYGSRTNAFQYSDYLMVIFNNSYLNTNLISFRRTLQLAIWSSHIQFQSFYHCYLSLLL